MDIYCLKLESNKNFLYVCCQNNKSDTQILLEAEILYNYLQTYKPISIIKKIKIDNNIEIDYDNIIGGIYSEEGISEIQINDKKHENICVENLITKYLCKDMSIEEIEFEKQELEYTLEKYKKEKQELEKISIDGSQIMQDIQWIKEECCKNMELYRGNSNISILKCNISREYTNKYKKILLSLQKIHTISSSFSDSSLDSSSDIYIKYPHFLLDDFFYHWHRIHLEEYMKEVERLCLIYQDMTNIIITKIKEIETHLFTYEDNLEWKIPRAIYLLNKKQNLITTQ